MCNAKKSARGNMYSFKKVGSREIILVITACLVLSLICTSAGAQNDTAMDWMKKASESLKIANGSSEELAFQEALNAFEKAIERDPHLMRAWLGKLDMLHMLERLDEFNRTLEEVVAVNPTPEGWTIRGKMEIEVLGLDQALASLNKSLEIDPKYAEALWLKGFIVAELSHYGEAMEAFNQSIQCFDDSIEADPNDANPWFYKGLLLNTMGRDAEAIVCLNRALELFNAKLDSDPDNKLEPNNRYIWSQKSRIFDRLGLTAEGRRAEKYAEEEL
jgi:tetratricopeptide (TPR) repeat protein